MGKKLDLTGHRFGNLTVLRPAENVEGSTAWVCRCDCGQETTVRTGNLRNGRTKACGCRRTRDSQDMTLVGKQTLRKRLDLTGRRFGGLTVLRPAENIGGQTAWVCRCGCGQETIVRTCSLRSGETKTCGCRNGTRDPMDLTFMGSTCEEKRILRKRLDLTGQRFGSLTVLRPEENIGGRTAWVCRCGCGQETVVRTNSLRNGETKTCGCRSGTGEAPKLTFVDGTLRRKLDLTGQRFGSLTALRPAENIRGRTAWVCRCDCGRETIAKTGYLRTDRTKACDACTASLRQETVKRNNTSGVTGVEWVTREQRWKATICFKGKRHYLGAYSKFEDAVKARKRAEGDLHDSFLREFAGTQT